MKRETLTHPKTYDLAARLQCSRPEALGYLTLLWDFTATQAARGNVGKFPNGAIARACDWQGSPDDFVVALTGAGFIDQDDEHRLLIHDWHKHCERWVKLKLEKLHESIICLSTEPSVERSVEATAEPSPPRDQTKPNQTKPNPNHSGAFSKLVLEDLKFDDRLFERFRRCVQLGAVEDTSAMLLNFVAAAERAIECGDKPPAMFRSIVEKREWNRITQAQEDRARERIKRRQRQAGTPSNFAAGIGLAK